MPVPVVQIRQMFVGVLQFFVRVRVGMGLAGRIVRPMLMLMVQIMTVAVAMGHRFVAVRVFVAFDQMHRDACGHQQGRRPKFPMRRFV